MTRKLVQRPFWIWLLPVLIFLSGTVPNLGLPGIQYDEVYYVPPAAALLKNQPDTDYVMLDPSVVRILGRPFPLMFNYYTSFFRTYLTLPVFALFGINVATIRGSSIFLSSLALVFFVGFTRRLTGSRLIAFATGLFLALDASFVAYTHNDYAVVSTMMALKAVALWALLRWWQGEGPRFLYLGVLMIGLGVTDRASFLWIPMALAGAGVWVYGTGVWREIRRRLTGKRVLLWAMVFFSAGAAIFLAFNMATLGGTFSPMLSGFRRTAGGVDNAAFLDNFILRARMLTDVLGGRYLTHFILGDLYYQTPGWTFTGSPLSWLAPLGYVYFLIDSARRRLRRQPTNRVADFLVSVSLILLVFTCFTPTLFRGHQLLMLYPFPHLIAGLFVFDLLRAVPRRPARPVRSRAFERFSATTLSGAFLGACLLIALFEARPVIDYHRMLVNTGGRGAWSDAIYEIVAEADRHPERTIVCMDWGFNNPLLVLTKRPVRTVRNYYEQTRRSPAELAELFDSTHVFLFHTAEYTLMPQPRNDFLAALELANAQADTIKVFYQRDGKPVAYLVGVQTKKIRVAPLEPDLQGD